MIHEEIIVYPHLSRLDLRVTYRTRESYKFKIKNILIVYYYFLFKIINIKYL